ncbi:MAG: hypothetical protein ACXVQR_06280 [Solirubrobacteraceae bacterium]
MSDEDRWKGTEPPERGPSAPPNLRFDPFATGLGVFFAVAVPIVVVGYTRSSGPDNTIIVIGVAVGLLAGVIAAVWLAARDGRVWRGPRI